VNKKILIIASIALAVDQITKALAATYLKLNNSLTIIPNFFYLTLCHNEGAAWGLFSNKSWIIIIGTIIAIIIIYHFIYCFELNKRNNLAFGLICGGLAGNLIDRFIYGYVIDFFDFYIFKYDYPVFNVADICLVIGVILLIYATIKGEDLKNKKELPTEEITVDKTAEIKKSSTKKEKVSKGVKKNGTKSNKSQRKTR